MERRVVLAVVLAIGVLFLTPRLFPPAERVAPLPTEGADAPPTATIPQPGISPVPDSTSPIPAVEAAVEAAPDSVVIDGPNASYVFATRGASLETVRLHEYRSLSADAGVVRLDSRTDPLVSYALVVPNDTIGLERVSFAIGASSGSTQAAFNTQVRGWFVSVRYDVDTAGYTVRATGDVSDGSGRAAGDSVFLIIRLPRSLESFEANAVEDRRGINVAFKPRARGADQIGLGSLDPNERRIEAGPLSWVALKSKYFILGLIPSDSLGAFDEVQVTGLPVRERDAPAARSAVVRRLGGGRFAFDVYAGPQQWDAMVAVGRDFQAANSYGGWLQPIVQPFATIVMRVLLWMHRNLNLHYGWVLLLFGVLVRVAMWPLNQTAMRSSMRMQELQPLLSEVQKRYKSDPQRLSAETMRLYKEHGMSPFSPLAGCFPILLSMPILFALFFVFQSTIEFRGVPFLWLEDLSLKDPLYIAPVLMGGSMFMTSWLTMKSTPPNPQTKIMTYVLPVMMTVLLANMASGLNLYWAAQNVASLPQQWLIARERAKARQAKLAGGSNAGRALERG
jgi:YidC/Oxa1 family membrane protein insertase